MQAAGAPHLFQFLFQLDDLVGQQPPVGFNLGFARAAHDPDTAALALKVGPGADKAGLFIAQARQLHLQLALAGAGPAGKDFQDQTGAVYHLDLPGLFQIALLDGCQGVIDHHHRNTEIVRQIV